MTTLRRVVRKSHIQALLLAGMVGLLATGCATYQQENHVITYWKQGNLTNAVVEATKMADRNANDKDTIIWCLEEGTVLRANGQYQASNKAFDLAQDRIDEYAREAKVKVGNEAGALLSNQANLPYTGRAYDGIMLNTYEALNYLALGEPDKARPEIIRAYQRQQAAVEENAKRIEKVQQEEAKSKDKATMDKAQQDPKFKAAIQNSYTNLDNLKPYANYVNPFTVYLDGLYFMANAADSSDLERAHKSFERVEAFLGSDKYIKDDLRAVDDLMNGKPLTPTTYVIFATGCAPERGQIRIDIPIILSKVSYVGAAFPTLEPQGNYLSGLTVTINSPTAITNDVVMAVTNTIVATNDMVLNVTNAAAATNDIVTTVTNMVTTTNDVVTTVTNIINLPGNTNVTTELLASMDSVIGLDFKNELPIIITKTIASTVTKAVAAYAINDAAKQQSDLGGLIAQIGTAVYQAAVNIADTRTWTTLPKEFQFCRFPTPPDRKIVLSTPGGSQKIPVTIEDGTINIVYVKSIDTTTPLLVSQMKLK